MQGETQLIWIVDASLSICLSRSGLAVVCGKISKPGNRLCRPDKVSQALMLRVADVGCVLAHYRGRCPWTRLLKLSMASHRNPGKIYHPETRISLLRLFVSSEVNPNLQTPIRYIPLHTGEGATGNWSGIHAVAAQWIHFSSLRETLRVMGHGGVMAPWCHNGGGSSTRNRE